MQRREPLVVALPVLPRPPLPWQVASDSGELHGGKDLRLATRGAPGWQVARRPLRGPPGTGGMAACLSPRVLRTSRLSLVHDAIEGVRLARVSQTGAGAWGRCAGGGACVPVGHITRIPAPKAKLGNH